MATHTDVTAESVFHVQLFLMLKTLTLKPTLTQFQNGEPCTFLSFLRRTPNVKVPMLECLSVMSTCEKVALHFMGNAKKRKPPVCPSGDLHCAGQGGAWASLSHSGVAAGPEWLPSFGTMLGENVNQEIESNGTENNAKPTSHALETDFGNLE